MSPRGGRRKGAGRKPIPEGERRQKAVTIALTTDEAQQLEELAEGEPVATYVHRLVARHLKRKRFGR